MTNRNLIAERRDISNYNIPITTNPELRRLRAIRYHLTLEDRMKHLSYWLQFKKDMEREYKRVFYNIAVEEGKRLYNNINSQVYKQYYQKQREIALISKPNFNISFSDMVQRATKPLKRWFDDFEVKTKAAISALSDSVVSQAIETELDKIAFMGEEFSAAELAANVPRDILDLMLRNHSFPACENTLGGYQNAIEKILSDGFANDLEWQTVSQQLQNYFEMQGQFNPKYMYDRIARNEVTRFANEAKMSAWEQMGIEKYEWIVGPGPCATEVCADIGQRSPYSIYRGPMPIDSTHVNCLCEIEPILPGFNVRDDNLI